MKRALSLILILALCLSGCALGRDRLKEPVTFYYLRGHSDADDYELFFTDGAISSETRESSGHRQDLNYLLALYLQGPMDPELESPFPVGSQVVEIRADDGELTVTLNMIASRINDMELTIACACLAKTCMALTATEAVTIESRGPEDSILFSRSFHSENLILEDQYIPSGEATEEAQ